MTKEVAQKIVFILGIGLFIIFLGLTGTSV